MTPDYMPIDPKSHSVARSQLMVWLHCHGQCMIYTLTMAVYGILSTL